MDLGLNFSHEFPLHAQNYSVFTGKTFTNRLFFISPVKRTAPTGQVSCPTQSRAESTK